MLFKGTTTPAFLLYHWCMCVGILDPESGNYIKKLHTCHVLSGQSSEARSRAFGTTWTFGRDNFAKLRQKSRKTAENGNIAQDNCVCMHVFTIFCAISKPLKITMCVVMLQGTGMVGIMQDLWLVEFQHIHNSAATGIRLKASPTKRCGQTR